MAWCHQATSHYLRHCWPRCMSTYGIKRPQWVNHWSLWDIKRSSWPFYLQNIFQHFQKKKLNLSKFEVTAIPADGLAPWEDGTSAVTVMTILRSAYVKGIGTWSGLISFGSSIDGKIPPLCLSLLNDENTFISKTSSVWEFPFLRKDNHDCIFSTGW